MKHLWWIIPLLLLAADLVAGVRVSFFQPKCRVFGKDPFTPVAWFVPSCETRVRVGTNSTYTLRTNSLGMADGAVREVPLSVSRRRVLLLGDSFTEGVGSPWEETFAGILAAKLASQSEILNAGISGSLPSLYITKVPELLAKGVSFNEAYVFLDVSDVFEAARFPGDEFAYIKRNFQGKATLGYYILQEAVCRFFRYSCLAFRPLDRIPWFQQAFYKGVLRNEWISNDEFYEAWGKKGLSICAADMDKVSQLFSEAKIPLTIVVYPWPKQVHERDHDSRWIRFWREWAGTHGIKFIDLTPALTDLGPEASVSTYYLPLDVHFSAEGHARVAKALLENMSQGTGAQ